MKSSKSALALASLLAVAGCSHNVKPTVVTKVEAPVYQKLPERTEAETSALANLGDLVYSTDNSVIRQKLAPVALTSTVSGSSTVSQSSIEDLTQDIRKTYGNVVSNPVSFPDVPGVFFLNGDALYHSNQGKTELVGRDLSIDEYVATPNAVYFISSGDKTRNTIKVIRNSSVDEIARDSEYSFEDLELSPDGKRAICARVPREQRGSLSLFNNREYVVLDLEKKTFVPLDFEKFFGRYEPKEGPRFVTWQDANHLLFTFVYSGQKTTNLHVAKLDGNELIATKDEHKQLTFDQENIDFAESTKDGIVYVSDKSGAPGLYLIKQDGSKLRIKDSFFGKRPYLRK